MNRFSCVPVVAAALFALGGCAVVYTDESGVRHAIGLMNMSIPSRAAADANGADWISTHTLGFSVHSSEIGGAVTVGFQRTLLMSVRGDACVVVDSDGMPRENGSVLPSLTKESSQ